MKYTTVRISGIIIQVAKTTDLIGYTEGVIESLLPDENQLTEKEQREWIKTNNKMMQDICDLLNKKY